MSRPLSLAAAALLLVPLLTSGAQAHPDRLRGRMLVVSDGDYLASTYGDGQLPPESAGYRDLLSVVDFDNSGVRKSAVPVSNSVTAAPEVLEVSPDGRTAFVVERLGERPPGGTTVRDLPQGTRLSVIDLSDKAPRVRQTVAVAALPEALDVSPDGKSVAVVANPGGRSVLQVLRRDHRSGAWGTARTVDLADLGVTARAGGDLATNVQWHPSGRFVAVNITNRDRVAFVELDRHPRLWGNIVATGKDPFVGRFSPDGRHYLTSNWGRDFTATDIEGRLPDTPSMVGVIRLGVPSAGPRAEHRVLGETPTDRSSEGLAISPDGQFVATVNMRGTALPDSSPEHDDEATVSLLRFDQRTGRLSPAATVPLTGVLPEGGTFDPTGRWFLASVFQDTPGVQLYRVDHQAGTLVPDRRITLPHGTHHVVMPTQP